MARELGRTVTELQDMPEDELLYWQVVFKRRPPTWVRDTLHHAQLMAAIFSLAGSTPPPISDYFDSTGYNNGE